MSSNKRDSAPVHVLIQTWFSSSACVDTNIQRNLPVRIKRSNILVWMIPLNLNIYLQIKLLISFILYLRRKVNILSSFLLLLWLFYLAGWIYCSQSRLQLRCLFLNVYLKVSKFFLHNKQSYNRSKKSNLQSSKWLAETAERDVKQQRGRWWNSPKQDFIRTCTVYICTRNK